MKKDNKIVLDDAMLSEKNFSDVCTMCGYFESNRRCPAFPNGIPDDIWDGENKHTEIHKKQVGQYLFVYVNQ